MATDAKQHPDDVALAFVLYSSEPVSSRGHAHFVFYLCLIDDNYVICSETSFFLISYVSNVLHLFG